jgi:hypothetical protein
MSRALIGRRPRNHRRELSSVSPLPADHLQGLEAQPKIRFPTPSNQSEILPFFEWLEETLGIKDEFGWAKVSLDDVHRLGGIYFILNTSSLHNLLTTGAWKTQNFFFPPQLVQ